MNSHYQSKAIARPRLPGARSALAVVAALGFATVPFIAQAASENHDVLYDTQTQTKGGCPSMAWHVVVHPDNTLNGVVSWDQEKHMAHLTGTVDKNGSFKANAVEQGSGKTDTVTGSVHGNDLKATINGTGTGCDNQTTSVPKATNASTSG